MTSLWLVLLLIAAAALLSLMFASLFLHGRIERLAIETSNVVAAAGLVPAQAADALTTLRQGLDQLHAAAGPLRAALEEERARRRRLDENLRESEERYALAISGGDDGMWEWNLKTGRVFYAPRWKSMLGYGEHDLGSDIGEWHTRIHPEDREPALAQIAAHLEGRSPRFEHEQRLRHRDGKYRWILMRAQAVRNASGIPYRLVGLATDVSARHEVHQVLLELADGLADLSGPACYRTLVGKLAGIIGVEQAFLTECCKRPARRVRMLAHWSGGDFAQCEEFDLAGTPCAEVIQGAENIYVQAGAGARWPGCGIESYLGLPCFDTCGAVIGHIACTSRQPMPGALPHHAILKLFAVRAAVEMERQWLQRVRIERTATDADATRQIAAPLIEPSQGISAA